MNRLIVHLPLLATLLFAASCAEIQDAPPYLVAGPVSSCGEKEGFYRFAGIEFDFYNKSERTVGSFSVSCRVFSADGKTNPLATNNGVSARFDGPVPPGEWKHLCIPLDSRILAIPDTPYLIDFFTVPEVVFTDGSVWTDPLCSFYTRSY